MQIIYDNIVFAIQKYGGISVVWQELLERQQKAASMELKYIDVDPAQTKNYSRLKLDIAKENVCEYIRHYKWLRYLPVKINANEPFIFHSSYYRYCTNPCAINVTTVHDFTYELFVKGLKKKIHTWQKFSAIRHSDAIVCISEYTKQDLLRLMPNVDEQKVKVIYNGVSEAFHVVGRNSPLKQLTFPKGSYVIFIGRRDSYKNFDLVVRCVAATSLNLIVIGSQFSPKEKEFVNRFLPSKRYQCLSNVPDEQLNILYNHAAALVYPSSYEGFGIPVLEAQRAGCPVIALNVSSIPEISGKTPLLMNELSEEEMVAKLSLLDNQELMQTVINEGLANSKRFSWEKMANEYLELYQSL